ncbi:MBL fold metallo-hydrolase [Arenimonas caeni]|jgi:ribonuclease BN (tRNA processing enzyme)|uniref:MBL fold metallo-hydrolase n=1 Tax=Arenimonas caeni TaxID=2058085 RepID=A0A2P6MC63_9GAMM|nr:MBL fold metallo-hydrolase [Arenimonas caeni]MDY0022956.1 MBL fold metallo-hydrolase [Arenimonas caeni]PRH83585.1 MBL fold metallo-hydrolase [Arenimonas caeni]
MSWSLQFLGVGNSQSAAELGSASAAIERDGEPVLMIDCGHEALAAWQARYGAMPGAVFVTHVHMDHVAGLERLFFATYFDQARRGRVRLYVPVGVLPHLQARLADYPGVVAEGDANWWDAFQLVPVSRGFWHAGQWYDVFPVRHHLPDTAFGLRLPGSLVWTGDTRPIPEMLAKFAGAGEIVAHDCALHGNPSHSGIDDLEREYPAGLLSRCVFYHYASPADAEAMRLRGHRVAVPDERLALAEPLPPPGQGPGEA